MRRVFLLSCRLHLQWFLQAFSRDGRAMAPLGRRRLLLLLLLYPFFLLLQGWHWFGFLIDEIFFRSYRKEDIREPLFITGIPRSGTTFIHRTLARDTRTFTTFRLWEAALAPSIFERRLIKAASRLDRFLGGPVHRLLERLTSRLTGRLGPIHEVGLQAAEEDYLCLLPAGGCFILFLAFPASPSLWQLGRFHEVPDDQRAIMVNFYRACIQKHLHEAPAGRRLLSKNAAFASWLPDLRFAFPDARWLVCIREPRSALSSQLSSLRPGLEFFATLSAADTISTGMQTVLAHAYRLLLEEKKSFLVDHLAVIDQLQLREEGESRLTEALRQLTIPVSPELKDHIAQAVHESQEQKSRHRHRPLQARSGPQEFGALVTGIYEEILRHPYMRRK